MTDKDKKFLIESVGLDWHERILTKPYTCFCGEETSAVGIHIENNQLDPLDPADMYGKIWVAFRGQKQGNQSCFADFLKKRVRYSWGVASTLNLATSASDLAEAMLEYMKEKKVEALIKQNPTNRCHTATCICSGCNKETK